MRWPRFASLALFMAPLLAVGCTAPPVNTIQPGYEGAPGVQQFLVCAPNIVLSLPAVLQASTTPLRREISDYLRRHGRSVEQVNLYDGKLVWNRAMARAKKQGDLSRTPALFAADLAKHFEFQAIVMPSILLHKTRVVSNSGTWDGVRRQMRIVHVPHGVSSARGEDTLADGIAQGGVTGEVAVTSLHVLVFSPKGEQVFEGQGGLEFVHELDMSRASRDFEFDYRIRGDLLEDHEVLREGIEIAFDPYLEPLEEAEAEEPAADAE